MNTSGIKEFEKAIDDFLKKPSQETYQKYLNACANAMLQGAEVIAPMIEDEHSTDKEPLVRLAKIYCGNKAYVGFYTSEKMFQKSMDNMECVAISLEMFAALCVDDESLVGVIINPSDAANASLNISTMKNIYNTVLDYKKKDANN